jgi:cytochrome c553
MGVVKVDCHGQYCKLEIMPARVVAGLLFWVERTMQAKHSQTKYGETKRSQALRRRVFCALQNSASVLLLAGVVSHASAATPIAPAAKPDLAKGKAIVEQQCASCHGADGNAPADANPKLAGQHPEYLKKQLNNFKVQPGQDQALRANAIMAGFASGLSAQDIDNVSAYLAAQTPKLGVATQKNTLKLVEKIYRGGIAEKKVPACAGCHAPNGVGIPAQYPRLAGQHAAYTNAQLVAFREGGRKNNEAMTGIAKKMTDTEMKAVADYIAGLR